MIASENFVSRAVLEARVRFPRTSMARGLSRQAVLRGASLAEWSRTWRGPRSSSRSPLECAAALATRRRMRRPLYDAADAGGYDLGLDLGMAGT